MKVSKAIAAGIIGGLAMTVLAWLGRTAGIELNGEMMLGTMLGSAPGPGTWTMGLVMHLVLSALIALLYAVGFERLTHRAGAGAGLKLSILHIVIAGLFMAMIPALHPMIPEQMPAPGAFLLNMGPAIVTLFVVEHLMFGAIVGSVYGSVLHPTAPPAPVMRAG
ncbi:MAG TPA: hypothetical protein VGQ52_03045 [Gemmatimonadaceae bacterium]|jgi:hypothetical protein|nr:hypothetical protein [Gemmatimonadaceae bacterium]